LLNLMNSLYIIFIGMRIVADFIVELRVDIEHDLNISLIFLTLWKLYFDGLACSDGQGI
jgi:hypothetical protein